MDRKKWSEEVEWLCDWRWRGVRVNVLNECEEDCSLEWRLSGLGGEWSEMRK